MNPCLEVANYLQLKVPSLILGQNLRIDQSSYPVESNQSALNVTVYAAGGLAPTTMIGGAKKIQRPTIGIRIRGDKNDKRLASSLALNCLEVLDGASPSSRMKNIRAATSGICTLGNDVDNFPLYQFFIDAEYCSDVVKIYSGATNAFVLSAGFIQTLPFAYRQWLNDNFQVVSSIGQTGVFASPTSLGVPSFQRQSGQATIAWTNVGSVLIDGIGYTVYTKAVTLSPENWFVF